MDRKEAFKYIITEFMEGGLPPLTKRSLSIPATKKIVSLVGSRRSGKTFYFYQTCRELLDKGVPQDRILYVNFEDDRLYPLEATDLQDLLEAYYELYPENKGEVIYFLFDEIQDIPGWELFVRRVYDKENARIFITGSSSRLLSREIATSLRGRTLSFDLLPLSFSEFLRFKGFGTIKSKGYSNERFAIKKAFEEYLNFGGFPEVVAERKELKLRILEDYFTMFIYRDLVERYSIRNIALLKSLSKYLITNIGSQFSINAYSRLIRKDVPSGKDTIMEYLSYLEDINLVHPVPLFSYSLKVQQVNPRKMYCIDNGLRNAVAFRFSRDEGRLAENVVRIELKRRGKEVYYWKGKGEVDFVVRGPDGTLDAVNVCYGPELDEREPRALLEFRDAFAQEAGDLLILTKDTEKDVDGIGYIPLWKWLLDTPK